MKSMLYRALAIFMMLGVFHKIQAQDITLRGGTLTVNRENGSGPNAGEGSLKLVDNNTASKFLINPFVSPLWMQFECAAPSMAAQYSLTSGGDAPGRDPKDWKMEGSDNGTDWTLLDTRTGQAFSGRGQTRIFDIANPATFKFYRITVSANNGDGLFQLAEWRLLEGLPPAAPTELQGHVMSGANIFMSWKRNAANDAATIIERSRDGMTFAPIASVNPTPTTYTAVNLQPNTDYYFRVKSTNRFGESAYSNVVNFRTQTGSGELINITQDGGKLTVLLENSGGPAAGEGSPKLIDNNNSTKYLPLNSAFPATGLWAQYEATVPYIPSAYTIVTGNDATDRDARAWRFEASNDGQNWTVLDTKTNINVPQRNFESFYPVTTTQAFKYFRLFVTQNGGSTSTVASFQVSEWRIFGVNPASPALPTNLEITGRTITTISLKWNLSGANNGVDIQRSEDGTTFGIVNSTAANATTYTDNDLYGGTQYWYRVRAKGTPTNSVWTDTVSIFTDWDPRLPLTPRGLTATPETETSIRLNWNDLSANETGFEIERSANGVSFTKIATAAADATSYVDADGPTKATRYWYRIRAINAEGTSFYSNIANAVTLGQNIRPAFDVISNMTTCSASLDYTVGITGISAVETWQSVNMSVTTNNPGLFSALTVSAVENGTASIAFRGRGARTAGGTATITVTATDNGGTFNGGANVFTRTFTVTINPLRVTITANPGTQIARYSTAQLTASGAPNYAWDDSAGVISPLNGASITVKPTVNTTYRVTGSNAEGCTADTTITVQLSAGVLAEAVNILTPNGDGKNDRWIVWNINRYPENTVSVFDRSGRLVFRQRNYSNNWDGTFNGKPLQEGAYYYVIELGSGIEPLKGTLTLIRERK